MLLPQGIDHNMFSIFATDSLLLLYLFFLLFLSEQTSLSPAIEASPIFLTILEAVAFAIVPLVV